MLGDLGVQWTTDIVMVNKNNHPSIVRSVLSGETDIGFVKDVIATPFLADGHLKVLSASEPIPSYVWVISPDVDPKLFEKIQRLFLELTPSQIKTLPYSANIPAEFLYGFARPDQVKLDEFNAYLFPR
jgi:ABC-type phosphate/phosphonate transport system substrate-binding protein